MSTAEAAAVRTPSAIPEPYLTAACVEPDIAALRVALDNCDRLIARMMRTTSVEPPLPSPVDHSVDEIPY